MADSAPSSGGIITAGSTADSGSSPATTLTYSQHTKKVDVVSSGVRMAMSPQQFCLRWNNHQSNIISVFEQLLQTESFVDVTLAVEGMSLKAHKVVLSACSPYFQAVLASHPDKHPIVILKDVRYTDMRDLLDFMYRGEVSVDQDNLSGFLRVAESLRIKGLTEVNEKKRLESSSQAAYLLPHAMAGAATIAPGVVGPMAPQTPLAGDPPPLKRPPHSPTATYCAKRRRGRPPKISGEESDCEVGSMAGSLSAAEGDDTRSEADVKVELDESREAQQQNHDTEETNHREHPETKSGESTPGPSGESKDPATRQTSVDDPDAAPRESPGSGHITIHHPEWTPHPDYDTDDSQPVALLTANKLQSHVPPPGHLPPHSVTETMDQLYYTKNLLEAAMLKNPYDALKNDKHLHGSILLASLRAPLKFGLHGAYERDGDRDLIIDSSPHSPHPSPQKPTQSSPTSNSPSNGNTNGSNSKVSVPIMSYCIQDNGFKCSKCFQTFTHPSNFHRHYITVHTDRRAHKCHVCGKEFKRKDNMMSHIRSVHRPGKEGHSIFREMSAVKMEMSALSPGVKMEMSALSPGLPRDVPPLQEQLMSQHHHHHPESQPLSLVDKA